MLECEDSLETRQFAVSSLTAPVDCTVDDFCLQQINGVGLTRIKVIFIFLFFWGGGGNNLGFSCG